VKNPCNTAWICIESKLELYEPIAVPEMETANLLYIHLFKFLDNIRNGFRLTVRQTVNIKKFSGVYTQKIIGRNPKDTCEFDKYIV